MRAGEMPSAAAAAWSDVVLNGAGGLTVRLLRSTPVTVAVRASRTRAKAAWAASSALKRAVACVTLNGSSFLAASPEMTQ